VNMSAMELKKSIYNSEGRTLMGQSFNALGSLVWGATNPEVEAAFGADILLLNAFSFDPESPFYGIRETALGEEPRVLQVADIQALTNRPIGVYLECPGKDVDFDKLSVLAKGRIANEFTINKVMESGAKFIILGGNPSMGASFQSILEAVKLTKEIVGDELMIFGGKWEGQEERVLGDPLAPINAKEYIAATIDNGADVISFPAPGSRTGITVDMIRELVEYTHLYKPGTLAMSFIDASVEGADVDTIRQIALMTKATGADIHTLGDAGLVGCNIPENMYQLSVSIKGKMKTYFRMASTHR
jgi:hypothetical protein